MRVIQRSISSVQLWVKLRLMRSIFRFSRFASCTAAFLLLTSVTMVEAKPPRWEYLVVSAGLKNQPLQQMLNNQGAQGWELVAFTPGSVAVFKRPKSK